MSRRAKVIFERQLATRKKLWPDVTNEMLWDRNERDGFVAIPRLMPLIMSIMDDLSGKGFPVGQTYLELWSRQYDELFLLLNRPEEMAFHAGFSGQRAVRTWKDRVRRLAELGFIGVKPGALGDLSYAIIFNPFHVIKRAFLAKRVQEAKWQALVVRANEIGSLDMDDIDDDGKLIEEEEEAPPPRPVRPKPRGTSAKTKP